MNTISIDEIPFIEIINEFLDSLHSSNINLESILFGRYSYLNAYSAAAEFIESANDANDILLRQECVSSMMRSVAARQRTVTEIKEHTIEGTNFGEVFIARNTSDLFMVDDKEFLSTLDPKAAVTVSEFNFVTYLAGYSYGLAEYTDNKRNGISMDDRDHHLRSINTWLKQGIRPILIDNGLTETKQ